MLEHHAHAQRARSSRALDLDFTPVPDHGARIGLDHAIDDLHQRGLARTVLAQDRVDLAGLNRQADPVVRLDSGIRLADIVQGEAWRNGRIQENPLKAGTLVPENSTQDAGIYLKGIFPTSHRPRLRPRANSGFRP